MITLQLRIKQARGEPITIKHFVIDLIDTIDENIFFLSKRCVL